MRVHWSWLAVVLGMLVAMTLPAYGQEEQEIDISEVPLTLFHLAQAAVPVTLTKAVVEVDPDGVLVYELSGEDAAGVRYEVDITGTGEIREVEKEITAEEVPELVRQALQTWFPDFQATFIERSVRPVPFEGTWYEFEGTDPRNPQELDIEIREDGKRIVFQEDIAG
jgi:hypothetical protein